MHLCEVPEGEYCSWAKRVLWFQCHACPCLCCPIFLIRHAFPNHLVQPIQCGATPTVQQAIASDPQTTLTAAWITNESTASFLNSNANITFFVSTDDALQQQFYNWGTLSFSSLISGMKTAAIRCRPPPVLLPTPPLTLI